MTSKTLPGTVDVAWLQENINNPDLVLVDATTHNPIPAEGPYHPLSGSETFQLEHIPGAVFADLLSDFADPEGIHPWTLPSSERFAEQAGALGIGDGTTVVVYDQLEGFWATRLWWHLHLEGFTNVKVLDSGLKAWKSAGLPVTKGASKPTRRTFTGKRQDALLFNTEDVEQAFNDDSVILVNVLDELTYRGDSTTYARKGHIPGSINVPVKYVLDFEKGAFRPDIELKKLFEDADLLNPNKTIVTYCGGGIAATGVAFALASLGQKNIAVYDGSMAEWAANPDLPLVKGEA